MHQASRLVRKIQYVEFTFSLGANKGKINVDLISVSGRWLRKRKQDREGCRGTAGQRCQASLGVGMACLRGHPTAVRGQSQEPGALWEEAGFFE